MPEILSYGTSTPQPTANDFLHLKALAISHDILGGLMAAYGLIAFIAKSTEPTHPHTPLLLMFVFGLAIAASGFFIHTRRFRVFSMIIAAILCLMLPIGTILGLFTLPVLARGSVGTLYRACGQNST